MFNNFLRMIFEENVRRFNEEVRRFNDEVIRTQEQTTMDTLNAQETAINNSQAVYDSNLETSQQCNNQMLNDMSINFGMNNMF